MNSPLDYFNWYNDLTIPDPQGGDDIATGIQVNKYLLGLKDAQVNSRVTLLNKIKRDLEAGKKQDPAYKIKIRIHADGAYEEREYSTITTTENDPLWMLIRYPFAGKGSPHGIQAALQLAATDGPGARAMVSPENIQQFCDDLLGLDCNGFVGSFLRHGLQEIPWWDLAPANNKVSPNDLISDIFKKCSGVERKKASEIDPDQINLLVMVDSNGDIIPGGKASVGHIAISQAGESTSTEWDNGSLGVPAGTLVPAICVVESTGAKKLTDGTNGLARSWYHYVDHPTVKSKGVIRMHRGVNNGILDVRVKAIL